jgi:hypothetical protein
MMRRCVVRWQLSVQIIWLSLAGVLMLALGACRDAPPDPTGLDSAAVAAEARGPTDPLSKVNRLPRELEQRVQALRADLEANGYEVARGYWTLWGVEDCKYPLRTVGFCYGNNPVAPYVIAVLPRWKDEFVDRSLHHALMAAQRNMAPNYRLDEREALVVVAELPPSARYFGIQSNVFTRETTLNPADSIYQRVIDPQLRNILFAVSPNPSRMMMVASIGNSTNNVLIEQRSGAAFDQHRYFVITLDESMADVMTAALLRAGVPTADHVFTEPVSPALVRVGLGREADDLITYIRYAMPNDSVAGEAWRERLPLTILRVRARSSSAPTNPFPIPAYEPRAWNYDERSALAGDLQALVGTVRAHWNQPEAETRPFFSAFIYLDLVGQHCLGYPPHPRRAPMNCLGDTQDTDYQISQSLHIDDGQVIALVGTLATETGNATYVSLSVNWFPALVGVQNLSDTQLKGSAADFAGVLQHDARLFYVHYLARDCSGLHPCVEIPRKLVPVGETIKVIQRNYVAPGSRRGPDPTKLLNPVAVVLDGYSRPSSW